MADQPVWTVKRLLELLGTEYHECRIEIAPHDKRTLMPVETIQIRADAKGDFVVVVSSKPINQ